MLALRCLPARDPDWTDGYLAAALLIDLDHLPLLPHSRRVHSQTPRPRAHTLLTPVALLAASRVAAGPWRPRLSGAAAGTVAHMARDLFSGPGLELLSPLSRRRVKLPYRAYAVGLAAAWRLAARRRSRP